MVSKGHLVQKEIWYDTFCITFLRELYFLFISVNYQLNVLYGFLLSIQIVVKYCN